jgi:ABC-type thiamine transport system substrate-binding protein
MEGVSSLLLKKKTWVGQDPLTSSTGFAFTKWAQEQGLTEKEVKDLFLFQIGSLAASFILFQQGAGQVLVGYTTTPLFALRQKSGMFLKAIPLKGAYEEWGIIVTPKGQNDPRTKNILQRLFCEKSKLLVQESLLLELVGS